MSTVDTLKRAADLLRNHGVRAYGTQVQTYEAALAAELEAMAEQEPVAWIDLRNDGTYLRHLTNNPEQGDVPIYTTPQLGQIPDGWQLVPIEPTKGMVSQGYATNRFCQRNFGVYGADPKTLYRAMLAAAPKEPKDCVGMDMLRDHGEST